MGAARHPPSSLQINQRLAFPIQSWQPNDFSGRGAKARETQMHAEELFQQHDRQHREARALLASHFSEDPSSPTYDAIDGAEKAVLYIPRPIGHDDFRISPRAENFHSKFLHIMTLLLHRDLSSVLKQHRTDSIDVDALVTLSRDVTDQMQPPPGVDLKSYVFSSFRQQRAAEDHLASSSLNNGGGSTPCPQPLTITIDESVAPIAVLVTDLDHADDGETQPPSPTVP